MHLPNVYYQPIYVCKPIKLKCTYLSFSSQDTSARLSMSIDMSERLPIIFIFFLVFIEIRRYTYLPLLCILLDNSNIIIYLHYFGRCKRRASILFIIHTYIYYIILYLPYDIYYVPIHRLSSQIVLYKSFFYSFLLFKRNIICAFIIMS